MPALATYELTKDYAVGFWRKRPYRALDRLTLDVEPGEVFGFLGPNGAGKTTTLKLLMQLVFPTSGRAEMLGRPVGDLSVKRRIGYLPENPYFYDYLTAEELLAYFAGLFGYRAGRASRARVSRLLDEVGIGAERRLQLRKFSKGMLQRVGIAQALINDPELVILDEPMSGLDPLGRRDVRALILRLRDRGCTVFFSSHVLSDAEALCSRVAILARGRLVDRRPADRHAGVPGPRLGAGRGRRHRRRWRRRARAHARGASCSSATAATRSSCRSTAARRGCSPSSPRPARRSCRSTRFETRSRTSSSSRSRAPTSRRAIAGSATTSAERAMRAIGAHRGQRVPRVGPRQGALQPRPLRGAADGRVVPASASSPPGRTSRSSRTSGSPRRRSSGSSSRSSSASGWCRRKSSGAASTACWRSRSAATSSSLGKYAGLVLTLAVNLAVMAARVVRRARLHGVDGRARRRRARGSAGARPERCSRRCS